MAAEVASEVRIYKTNKNEEETANHFQARRDPVKHRSILEYANFRWFKLALLLCAITGAVYIWHDPPLKPYGGTWLGYTLGTIGALLILWLLYFGVRKRRYKSNVGTAQGGSRPTSTSASRCWSWPPCTPASSSAGTSTRSRMY